MHPSRTWLVQTIPAGLLYFALVFGAGFLLGPIRILWLVPKLGTRAAELMEAPVMLVVILAASKWLVRRMHVAAAFSTRFGMGLIALALLVTAEFSLVLRLRGLTVREYLASRDPVSGTVYYVMLAIMVLAPVFVGKETRSGKPESLRPEA